MMAADGDSTQLELDRSPLKKRKTDTKPRSETESETESDVESNRETDDEYESYGGRRFLKGDLADEEYQRQYERFYYQFEKSEGFVVDWDNFDFLFAIKPVAWAWPLNPEMSNDELVHMLTLYALNQHNQEKGTNLAFVEHVEANFMPSQGFVFWITFRTRDLSSPSSESKLYQTKVWKFLDEIEVCLFRPRPTDEEIASVYVAPPPPLYYDPDKPPRVFT